MENIRHSIIAGSWYPGTERKLRDQINQYLDLTKIEERFENVAGIISPHAGYQYSGKTAAYGYNTLKEKNYETVVVISPSHREYFPGVSIYAGDAYETPLGVIQIDKEIREKLTTSSKIIFAGEKGHSPTEHALEIQLPFLQVVLNEFNLVPIVIGDQRSKIVYEFAEKLAGVMSDKLVIVASSDLSHFHPKNVARKFDAVVGKSIEQFDYEGLQESLERNSCEACGGGGIVALMKAAELNGFKKAKVLAMTDSGDVTGDDSGVVGYLSAVVYK